ncbi:L-histidine N(alpha)-methyltransferase [Galbibacter sp. BG1]
MFPINSIESTKSIAFLKDVLKGLQCTPKYLYPKYLYDQKGDLLFQQIMNMPEYYPTACELEIFQQQTNTLVQFIDPVHLPFDIIELGAGDALKSKYLLKAVLKGNTDVMYLPIDISSNVLDQLKTTLSNDLPDLKTVPFQGDYFQALKRATAFSNRRKVVLCLGGNIGNMEYEEAILFCRELHSYLSPKDLVLVGFDLKKHPQTILNAYNDASGITAAFNINLLKRINRELSANFKVDRFEHYQTYNPLDGACRSFLVSLEKQHVQVANQTIFFEKDEVIHMEISQKFNLPEIQNLALQSGFNYKGIIKDSKNWFADVIWEAQ